MCVCVCVSSIGLFFLVRLPSEAEEAEDRVLSLLLEEAVSLLLKVIIPSLVLHVVIPSLVLLLLPDFLSFCCPFNFDS